MTLIPITKRTTYCFVDCGKELCSCKPTKFIDMKYTAVLGSKRTFDLFIDIMHDKCKYKHIKQPHDVMGLEFESIIKLYDWQESYRDPYKIYDLCISRIR